MPAPLSSNRGVRERVPAASVRKREHVRRPASCSTISRAADACPRSGPG
jgi:hypothetical protein